MSKEFEIINHTADVGVIAYGADMKEAFANAAKALFSLITEPGDMEGDMHWDIELTAPDEESLLVAWLNELIYLFDAESVIFNKFDITQLSQTHLEARSYGHKIDSSRDKIRMGVKAATYHMLKVDRSNRCQVQVLFDI